MNAILLHHPLHFPGARSGILTDARDVLAGLAATLRDDVLAAHRRVVRAGWVCQRRQLTRWVKFRRRAAPRRNTTPSGGREHTK